VGTITRSRYFNRGYHNEISLFQSWVP